MNLKRWWLAPLCGAALVVPAVAQEEPTPKEPPPAEAKPAPAEATPKKKPSSVEDPALHRWGGWTLSVAGWDPALIGAEEEIATIYNNGLLIPLVQGSNPRIKETAIVAYHLPKDVGSVVMQYDAMNHNDTLKNYSPSNFAYLESRAFPDLTGVFDDGFSDGVDSSALRRTREFRLEYQNKAFETRWAKGTWGVGYREISHNRALGITYHAIAANLPPIIPPNGTPDDQARLTPLSDTVSQESGFTGHGLGASLHVEFTLHPRVSVITGLSIGLVRGRQTSSYQSTSWYYFLDAGPTPQVPIEPGVPLTKEQLFDFLNNPPPLNDPNDPTITNPQISDIQQGAVVHALHTELNTQLAESFDVYIGLQVIVYKGVRIFATLRDTYYQNVGSYVVPTTSFSNQTTVLSAGYEGYQLGVSWRF
jgi:hypothetical protein